MYRTIWVYKSIFEIDFMKSKYRSNTSDENLVSELRCAITPNFNGLEWKKKVKYQWYHWLHVEMAIFQILNRWKCISMVSFYSLTWLHEKYKIIYVVFITFLFETAVLTYLSDLLKHASL